MLGHLLMAFHRWNNYFLGPPASVPFLGVTQSPWLTSAPAIKRKEEDSSVFHRYQIICRTLPLFLHCSCPHRVVFKATLLPTEINTIGYCRYVTFTYTKDSADIWRMFLLIAYCRSRRLEGRESLASDCYPHDKKGLQSHLINLLWSRMSHWHFKLSCFFVHRIILSLNSLSV